MALNGSPTDKGSQSATQILSSDEDDEDLKEIFTSRPQQAVGFRSREDSCAEV